jgi:CubicO group peptidase (beta-lactamase class C family)
VTSVWPEFGINGKQDTTIRDLFTHRAGLVALDTDLSLDDLAAWTPVISAIENQKPLWEPGTDFAYHALTSGWLIGEVLRRVTGIRPRELMSDYLTTPLGVDAWIGLPASEEPRVAWLQGPPETDDPLAAQALENALSIPVVARSVSLGGALSPTFIDGSSTDYNSRKVHEVEIPAANGILTAQSVAKIYGAAVSPIHGNTKLLSSASIADATTARSYGDAWSGAQTHPGIRFSTGFLVNGNPNRPLLSDASFGHDGASGGLGFADADAEIGFGYVNNQFGGPDDQRANRLTRALRECLSV